MCVCRFQLPFRRFHFRNHLPIILIDTFNTQIPDENKIPARMTAKRHFIFFDFTTNEGRIGIELRGQSSQTFPKKSFGIETRHENDENRNDPLLGLPEENDWILYGPYVDKSLLRNYLAYRLSRDIGRYASRVKFVELYLNETNTPIQEQYWGVYLLLEKIKRDSSRVNITRLEPHDNSEPEISGGYILKIDKIDPGDLTFTTDMDTVITFVYPKEEDLTVQQISWIRNYFSSFERALAGPKFEQKGLGFQAYIDVYSFVDFLLLNEAFRNVDAFRFSTFFHKDREGKIVMGPIWDYNLSMGNVNWFNLWETSGWLIGSLPEDDPNPQPFWWSRLLQSGVFVERLIQRWFEIRQNQFDSNRINQIIDDAVSKLRGAHDCNFEKWNVLGVQTGPNWHIPSTYEGEIEYLKNWVSDRFRWIDENIESLRIQTKNP